jgi:hypothetical protein
MSKPGEQVLGRYALRSTGTVECSMLEIIIMIGVIGWFWRTARDGRKNSVIYGVFWAIIGALSYYIPVLVFMIYIYPAIIKSYITVTYDNQITLMLTGLALNIAVGAFCCFLASRVLVSQTANGVRSYS